MMIYPAPGSQWPVAEPGPHGAGNPRAANSVARGAASFTGHGRRGATAVEFALVAPVFFMIVLGMVEVGRGLMVVHLLNNAARQGCRAGVLPGKTTSQINTVVIGALQSQGISGETA